MTSKLSKRTKLKSPNIPKKVERPISEPLHFRLPHSVNFRHSPMPSAIEVQNLRKTYRDGLFGRRRIEALRGISFAVQPGEIFGLLGPNGAGKTTLIKVLLGVVRRSEGEASLLGRPAGDRIGRRGVGYLPENHRIPRHHTGNTALAYYGGLSGLSAKDIRARRPHLLDVVGLASWGNTPVRKYSKGMLQRLGLAQALLHDPQVLILDEPTDGVDPVGRSEMRVVLQQLKTQGKTVFINSHLLQEVELVCDRVAILNHGRVLREGKIAELTRMSEAQVQFTLAGPEAKILAVLDDGRSVPAGLELRMRSLATGWRRTVPGGDAGRQARRRDRPHGRRTSPPRRQHRFYIVPNRQTLEEAFLTIILLCCHRSTGRRMRPYWTILPATPSTGSNAPRFRACCGFCWYSSRCSLPLMVPIGISDQSWLLPERRRDIQIRPARQIQVLKSQSEHDRARRPQREDLVPVG